MLIKGVIKI